MVLAAKASVSTRLINTGQPDLWRSVLPASRYVFGSVEFCSIVQHHQGLSARLFVFTEEEEALVAYPFFLRGVDQLPYLQQQIQAWDTKTPEYTGPIPLRQVSPRAAAGFRQAFSQFCEEAQIIAEFAHLHPWAGWQALLDPARVAFDRQIVYIDLTMPLEQMWEESFTYACRKNIRRAQRENVRIFQAACEADLDAFHSIYTGTMDRNQASKSYYFPRAYFADLLENLPDNALILLAEYQDRIVAGTLYLYDDENMYSYLGGADHAYQQVRPTNQVIYEAIRWGQAHGKKRLILGGGYRPDDGIFRFKSSFSPLKADFHVYRSIHLAHEYQQLCRAWEDYYAEPLPVRGFFPLYRVTPSHA